MEDSLEEKHLRRKAEKILAKKAGSQKISSGDVLEPQIIVAEDEVWSAASAFTSMQMQLSGAVGRLGSAGLRISTTTEQLLAATSAQHAGSAEQSVSLNETTATTEELARSARQIAENAGSVAEIAERTLRATAARSQGEGEGGPGARQSTIRPSMSHRSSQPCPSRHRNTWPLMSRQLRSIPSIAFMSSSVSGSATAARRFAR